MVLYCMCICFQGLNGNGALSGANIAQIGATDLNDPKLVLHIIVDNLVFPVSIDVLKQVRLYSLACHPLLYIYVFELSAQIWPIYVYELLAQIY